MRRRAAFVPALVALAAALALAVPAAARPRVDLVLLVKGDRMTGEIVRLEGGTLSTRSLAAGTVDIDWPDVTGLVSAQLFEVERIDGVRLVGHFGATESEGVLRIVQAGGSAIELPLTEIVGIDQLGANLWRSRRGRVDIGSNFAHANQETSFTLGAELALKARSFRWVNTLDATVTDDDDREQRQREVFRSQLEIPAGTSFVVLTSAQHERNDELGLKARDSVGGVFAWVPINGARGRVLVGPGVGQSREDYFDEKGSSSLSSAILLAAADYDTFGRFGTRASIDVTWYPLLSGPSRNRVEAHGAIRQKLGSDFTISISPYYSFDSRPPAPEAPSQDWGWVTSLGLQF